MANNKPIYIRNVPTSSIEELETYAAIISKKRKEKITRNDLIKEIIEIELNSKSILNMETKFVESINRVDNVISNLVDKIEESNNLNSKIISILIGDNT